MAALLYRQELACLHDWAAGTNRKPLVIRGARQVGKSTLVRQFSESIGIHLVELNFERNPEFREVFSKNDPVKIIMELQLLTGKKIRPGETLMFLDEVQSAPEVLQSLRYFYEEKPDLHVIAAGSLLEFTLANMPFSMPVGRIEYMHLGPMRFSDFLHAAGYEDLAENLQGISIADIESSKMSSVIHNKYMELLREYWITGGLPEAIAGYVNSSDFSDVSRILKSIVATYRDDFHKYGGRSIPLIQKVFDQLPVMTGRKFTYTSVSRDHRAAEISDALQHLCMARIASKVFHTSANGVPLAAEVNEKFFKTIFLDIGLLNASLKLNVLDLNKEDLTLINNGALAEQFIGQHLLYGGQYFETPELYYWTREAKSSSAEIDYVMTSGQHVIPIEIKAGTTGTLKSLHQFLREKRRSFALRFNTDVPSLLSDQKKLTDGTEIEYKLLSLPLYMVEIAPKQIGQILQKV